jgi:ABC-type proline/glycine betaine transport system permease subunit
VEKKEKAMAGVLGLFFLGVFGYSIYRSGKRVKTALITLALMVVTIPVVAVVGISNPAVAGKTSVDVAFLVGALTALIFSRRSKA